MGLGKWVAEIVFSSYEHTSSGTPESGIEVAVYASGVDGIS
jgi:hypothetical protein